MLPIKLNRGNIAERRGIYGLGKLNQSGQTQSNSTQKSGLGWIIG
jgi:hypothetical protein